MNEAVFPESDDPDGPRGKAISPAALRELSLRSDLQGTIRTLSHYAVIIVLGTTIWLVSSIYGPLWAMPLVVVQGYFVAFLFMAVHETAHKTAFKDRRLNLAVGHLSSFLIALPYEYYCLFHWDHHRYTQNPDKDPELLAGPVPSSDAHLAVAYSGLLQVGIRVRLMLRHALTGRVGVPWVPQQKRATVVTEARLYLAAYALLLLASIVLSSALLLWVWLLPLLLGQMFLRPYLYAEHTGCERTRSAFQNTRTTYTALFVRWFAWNMPYHVEHHAYPSVPFHALPKLNQIVDDRIMYRGHGYLAVTRETWTWFRRSRQPRSRLA